MAVDKSDYSKAYYNQGKRRKVHVGFEVLTPELADFIFKKSPKVYAELFNNNMKYLTSTKDMTKEEGKYVFLVVRSIYGKILAYSRLDKNKKLIGDSVIDKDFTEEQFTTMRINDIDYTIINEYHV